MAKRAVKTSPFVVEWESESGAAERAEESDWLPPSDYIRPCSLDLEVVEGKDGLGAVPGDDPGDGRLKSETQSLSVFSAKFPV